MANRNRTAGHNWERDVVKHLHEIGFTDAVTSRMESKSMDDSGIDICNTPGFNIQCKSSTNTPNYHELLGSMPDDGIRAVFHRKTVKSKGGRFIPKGEYVTVRFEDFLQLMHKFKRKKTNGSGVSRKNRFAGSTKKKDNR
jgi:hypothetical protein